MAGCRFLICGSKIGRNNAAPPENMLENWGGYLKEFGMVRKGWVSGRKERSWDTTVGEGQEWGGKGGISKEVLEF